MNIEKKLKNFILEKYGSIYAFAKQNEFNETSIRNMLNRNVNKSTGEFLFKLCQALNIDFYALMKGEIKEQTLTGIALTQKEHNIINQYRALDDFGVRTVDFIVNTEYERNRFYENNIENLFKFRYDLPAAAGYGSQLDDQGGEFVKIPKTREAEYSDYIVKVSGDSMEPTYSDGDFVLVKSQPAIDIGQVGIFVLNGEGYIKEQGLGELISHNKQYDPIIIRESDELRCCGLVLGKTEIIEERNK